MNDEQAIMVLEILKQCLGAFIANHEGFEVAIDIAIEALEKQIPKQPVKIAPGNYICPACQFDFAPGSKCCNRCGQVLDWSEVDE